MQRSQPDPIDFLLSPVSSEAPECAIFSEVNSSRLLYTGEFIFNRTAGVHFRIITAVEEARKYKGCLINYSQQIIPGSFQILPQGLLFKQGIDETKPELKMNSGLMRAYLNPDKQEQASLNYDIFSMVFYFISRYEEWQSFKEDEHGRFTIENSLLFQYGMQTMPLIDQCVHEFKQKLQQHFEGFTFPPVRAKLVSTLDVDNLYAYRGKSWSRLAAATIKDLFKGDFYNVKRRFKVAVGKEMDPFDIYNEIASFCSDLDIPLIVFFLLRSGTKYDRTIQPKSRGFNKVISQLTKHGAHIGLHPSYYTSTESLRLLKEKQMLEKKLNENIVLSRQHFLRFRISSTPNLLSNSGIKADFSMGYANAPGFRAGTSFPFRYFDFNSEQAGSIHFIPFCFMDGAFSIHQKLEHSEIMSILLKMSEEIIRTGGNFISVFHERSFDDHLYPGFGTLYREIHHRLKDKFQN